MSASCLDLICCEEELGNCFTQVCGKQSRVDSAIAGIAIIENDDLPEIGESVTISTSPDPVVITECNEIEVLYQWAKDRLFACDGNGAYYHLITGSAIRKGSRAKATNNFTEQTGSYFSDQHKNYETTSEINLGDHFLANNELFCSIMKRNSSISLIYFLKQGGFVLRANKGYNISLMDAGFEIVGDTNEFIEGSISFKEKGECQPSFSFAQDPSKFISKIKEEIKFTFAPSITTGLVEVACGNSGKCKNYSVAVGTPFTISAEVNELVSCGQFILAQNCADEMEPLLPIEINDVTGMVESAGLPAGTYKFTRIVRNSCCVKGSDCFQIKVA